MLDLSKFSEIFSDADLLKFSENFRDARPVEI